MEKICSNCKNTFDISLFQKHVNTKDGLGSWCKNCIRDKSAEKRRENGIEPRRVGIDLEKQKIRSKKYKEKTFYEIPKDLKFQKCSKCDEIKDITCFRKRSYYIDGLSKQCKSCDYKGSKSSRETYKTKKWAYFLLKDAERHSDKPILIDENFVLELFEKQNGLCYWFKVKLQPSSEPKYPWQPSLDRLDRTKGYTKDNVVLACYTANIGRNTTSAEIFNMFVLDLRMALKD